MALPSTGHSRARSHLRERRASERFGASAGREPARARRVRARIRCEGRGPWFPECARGRRRQRGSVHRPFTVRRPAGFPASARNQRCRHTRNQTKGPDRRAAEYMQNTVRGARHAHRIIRLSCRSYAAHVCDSRSFHTTGATRAKRQVGLASHQRCVAPYSLRGSLVRRGRSHACRPGHRHRRRQPARRGWSSRSRRRRRPSASSPSSSSSATSSVVADGLHPGSNAQLQRSRPLIVGVVDEDVTDIGQALPLGPHGFESTVSQLVCTISRRGL